MKNEKVVPISAFIGQDLLEFIKKNFTGNDMKAREEVEGTDVHRYYFEGETHDMIIMIGKRHET